jgi:phage terminase large subunit-like protein
VNNRGGFYRAQKHSCLSDDAMLADAPSWLLSRIHWTYPQNRLLEALSTHDFVIYSGGNGAGKTTPAVAIAAGAMLGFFDCPECHAHPDYKKECPSCRGKAWCPTPADIMLVGLAKAQARDAMQKYIKKYVPHTQIHNATRREGLYEVVETCNGSICTVYTVGQGEDTHQGGRRSLIVYDEQPSRAVVEEGLFRYRTDMDSKILITMTPTKGTSWVYDELICQAEDKGIALVTASVFENGIAKCRDCDKIDEACECRTSKFYTPPCGTCGKDRDQWNAELRTRRLRRQTAECDALCWRCKTYGVEPRIPSEKLRKAEKRVTDPKRLAMRLHGRWAELRGDRVFDPAEVAAMYAACKPPLRTDHGVKIWADRDGRKSYVVGVDGALGTGNDETVVTVLDVHSGEQVAVWGDNESEPSEYLEQIVELAEEYGGDKRAAKVWCENISAGYYLLPELDRLGIPLYRHRSPDKKLRKVMQNQLGFTTSPRNRDRLLHAMIGSLKESLIWKCECHDAVDCPDFAPRTKVSVQGRKGGLIVRDRKTVAQLERLFYNSNEGNKIMVTSGHDDRVFALAGAHDCRQKAGAWGYRKQKQKLNAEERYWAAQRAKQRHSPIGSHPFVRGALGGG